MARLDFFCAVTAAHAYSLCIMRCCCFTGPLDFNLPSACGSLLTGWANPSAHAHILRWRADAAMVSAAAAGRGGAEGIPQRRVTLLADDGGAYAFVLQLCPPQRTRAELATSALLTHVNTLLAAAHGARRRGLALATPIVVPLTPRARLLRDARTLTSLGAVAAAEAKARGVDPYAALQQTRAQMLAAASEAHREARRAAADKAAEAALQATEACAQALEAEKKASEAEKEAEEKEKAAKVQAGWSAVALLHRVARDLSNTTPSSSWFGLLCVVLFRGVAG